jgi:hypothetical protein
VPLEPCVAAKIALGLVADIVAHTVDLDREPRLRAMEIQHVRTDRMLAAKRRQSRRALA